MKKTISLILAAIMILGCTSGVFAADEAALPEDDDLALREASLGEFIVTDANAYTPSEAENLLIGPGDHAYQPKTDGQETLSGEYMPGEILYAKREGGLSLSSSDVTDRALASLGVKEGEAVYTEASGSALALQSAEHTVWYRAEITGEVEETVKAVKELGGIVDAEPNYVYTTEAVGEPTAAQLANQWYIGTTGETVGIEEGNKDNSGLHKGWYKHWQKNWTEGNDAPDESLQTSAPGEGVVVAVIDTGVDYTHEDLASSMWQNPGEIPGNGVDDDENGYIDDVFGMNATANPRYEGARAGDPMDNNGHGTHVAGIIAMANNDVGGVGVAFGAKIMAIKAGQVTGSFSSADIAEAIQYATSMGADVINMSFGGTGKSNVVEQALEDAFATCVLVAAAGNDAVPTNDAAALGFFPTEDIYPASYRYVLGVMASDESGQKASFSNWDFTPNANAEYEMIAPGTHIYSALPGNRYASWSGTSMAAPVVAGAAAVLRGYYADKDEYNTRFVMGQLASATEDTVTYVDEKGSFHIYSSLDLYDSMTNLPKPDLKVSVVFALDNVRTGTENDGDRIVDAGETIDLGIAIRNRWGRTGAVTVTADDLSIGGVPTGFVDFIENEIALEPIGTYSETDNGYVYDDSLLVDVSDPIRFTVAPDTPNDSLIAINLNITTTNGLDTTDLKTYTTTERFTFRVQKGAAIRGHITEDTTLTKDRYWIIENSLIVDPDATLTVEEGTQLQFWSSDYEDAYGEKTMAYIKNDGTLNMIGTAAEPIEIFPGAGFENFVCEISGDGVETFKYCNMINPRLGYTGTNTGHPVDVCDHCTITQTEKYVYYRNLSSATISERAILTNYATSDKTGVYESNGILLLNCSTTAFNNITGGSIDLLNGQNCLFDGCYASHGNIKVDRCQTAKRENSVFLGIGGGIYNLPSISTTSQYDPVVPEIPNTYHCAVLNPLLDTNPDGWTHFVAPPYIGGVHYPVNGNYWGTENDILINKMIQDDDDFAGTLADIDEKPILTLESSELENIYPFVTKIWLTEEGGSTPLEDAAPGVTYDVHVTYNRDMAQDIRPMVTYGGEAPYTDYTVHGDWVSAREWVGTTKISPVSTGGTQIFRAKGGAAADDRWLVCGTDELRFDFDINMTLAQSVVLNATGGVNKIDLTWIQNEYDVLAGYNLYRSASPGSGFAKINESLLTGTTYTDTTVAPGTTYYYYYTIVDTDGNEIGESKSNTAFAAPLDNVKPTLIHTPILSGKAGQNVSISAAASDNISVSSVTLYYRAKGETAYKSKTLTYNDATGKYTGYIPKESVTATGAQYYLEVTDGAGNRAQSGSKDVPYNVATDSTPTVLAVSPSTVSTGDRPDMTIYGTNFAEGQTVKLGVILISDYDVNEAGTEITFKAPALPIGSYAVSVAGVQCKTMQLVCRDTASFVQINSAEALSGEQLRLPVYTGVKGELTALHLEIAIPSDKFSAASVEVPEGGNVSVTSNLKYGVMTVSAASATDFNPGEAPFCYLVLTPKSVTAETYAQITLNNAQFNGSDIITEPQATSITVYPNFSLNAEVKYYKGGASVEGVTVKAGSAIGTTGADGKAAVTGIKAANVNVSASRSDYVHDLAYISAPDAVLVLRYCAGLDTLDAIQLKAADVDASGTVNEVDASLILKFIVEIIDEFPAGAWCFTPEASAVTLTTDVTNLNFTAILIGDVNGSWTSAQ